MAATCSVCGRTADGETPPLTWSSSTTRRGIEHVCETCTRENVRAIEGKLDEEHW